MSRRLNDRQQQAQYNALIYAPYCAEHNLQDCLTCKTGIFWEEPCTESQPTN